MTMKDFIEQEKQRLQVALLWFNSRGSRMTVSERGSGVFLDTLVDSFTVTRIAPHFDAAGNHLRTDFWLLWKALGYDEGFQYAHTIKVINVQVDDNLTAGHEGKETTAWLIVDLTDDLGRIHHIEVIEPVSEPELAADWQRWIAYRQKNAERFLRIDDQLQAEHLRIAEDWS